MIQAANVFAKQLLSLSGFKGSYIPSWVITALLTAFSGLLKQEVVILKPLLKFVKRFAEGVLIIDDTSNPKYGLKRFVRKLKILSNGGYADGYKILLFLWECPLGRIPIGFALWGKGTKSLNDLTLVGLSLLRNRYHLKPDAVVADAAFCTDKLLKRLEGYGWPCVMRFKKNRKLGDVRIDKLIPRGYGDEQGELKNGVKVKVFRRKSRFFVCNRMLWSMQDAVKMYTKRWKIEEVFRVLKSCLGLKRCQQHSVQAQLLFIFMLLLLFSGLELATQHSTSDSVYKTAQAVISGKLPLEKILKKSFFRTC